MNIVLIGYRGAGKTIAARELARRTGRPMYSTDVEIERAVGMTIAEYVEANGWDAFRDAESQAVRECSAHENAIIDTGGGAILRPENVDALRNGGSIVWLTASPETIRSRIAGDERRPSLTGAASSVDEVDRVLAERTPAYAAACDIRVPTDGLDEAGITDAIVAALKDAGIFIEATGE